MVLGNAFFGSDEIKERKNGQVAIKIGTTLDNSDVTTWLFMELHESRRSKLADRARKGRGICVHGYIREYRKEGDTSHLTEQSLRMTSRLAKKERTAGLEATGKAAGGGPDTGLLGLENGHHVRIFNAKNFTDDMDYEELDLPLIPYVRTRPIPPPARCCEPLVMFGPAVGS